MGIAHHEVNFDSVTFENSAICINLPNKKQITVVSIYRPPHGLIDTAELNRIFCSNSQVICFGDFNAKHSSLTNRNGHLIYDWVNNNNFSIIAPLLPTYFSNSYALNATLDFAVVKNISAAEAVAINALHSDHNPVWFEFLLQMFSPSHSDILQPQIGTDSRISSPGIFRATQQSTALEILRKQ
ncbi:hypothetical protein AVEN_63446-1 [Araneus ventricosus]|uniref:Endonuclease/exonuclease/phosphatase domain-containing protein n=1 Tax=Araneus ventricosus TaxID=182803 RepID=A0A4Y2L429_ARAVE|nr:hypothetical protein AVEN_63446-1 [Araneus ventricosus]